MSKVVIKETDDKVELDNIKIRDKQLIPDYQINKTNMLETFMDGEGNITGYRKTKGTISTITLRPDEAFKMPEENEKK